MDEKNFLQILKEITQKHKQEEVDKDYVNPSAAIMMALAGHEVITQNNTLWKADTYSSYFAEFTRTRHFQGMPAEEQVKLIIDNSAWLNKYNTLYSDNPIIPFDFWNDIPEQLTDTIRLGVAAPQDDTAVTSKHMNWAVMFGDEMYVYHMERQFNLPIEVIRQYLYKPSFESDIEAAVSRSIGNDLVRLAVNGTGIAYASGDPDFYKLLKSFYTILKEAKGIKSLPSGLTRWIGQYGHYVTPIKIDAPALRFAKPFSDTGAADTSSNYSTSAGTFVFSVDHLRFEGGGPWAGATVTRNAVIPVLANTEYVAKIDIKGHASNATDKFVLTIMDTAGNTLAQTPSIDVPHAAYQTVALNFNSYNNLGIRWKMQYSLTSADVDLQVINLKVERASTRFAYHDVAALMDVMIDNYPQDFSAENNLRFQLSRTDAALFAQFMRIPVYVNSNGQIIPMATETREDRMLNGQGELQYRGYPVSTLPYGKALDKGGYMIFGPDVNEYRIGAQRLYSYTREYKARMKTGGEGYEYTYHMYMSYGVRVPGKFVIAEGTGSTLKCEDLTFGTDFIRTGSRIGSSGTAVTISKGTNPTSYIFCDTPDCEIYYASAVSTLVDYATAAASGTLYVPGVNVSSLSTATHYFRAFKDGVCQPSQIMTLTLNS